MNEAPLMASTALNTTIKLENGKTYVTYGNQIVTVYAYFDENYGNMFRGTNFKIYYLDGTCCRNSNSSDASDPDPIVAEVHADRIMATLETKPELTLELDTLYKTPSGKIVKITAVRMLILEADVASHRKLEKYLAYEGNSTNPFNHALYLSNGTALPSFTSRGFTQPENLVEMWVGDPKQEKVG